MATLITHNLQPLNLLVTEKNNDVSVTFTPGTWAKPYSTLHTEQSWMGHDVFNDSAAVLLQDVIIVFLAKNAKTYDCFPPQMTEWSTLQLWAMN